MSSGEDKTQHIEFNDDVIEKMKKLLEESSAEKMKDGIHELMLDIELRNQRLRLTVTDEMERMPREMQCAVFEHYSDLELADVIIIDENLGLSAGYELKRRKRRLHNLMLHLNAESVDLRGAYQPSKDDTHVVIHPYNFCSSKRMSCPDLLRDYASAFLYVILAYYGVSDGSIQGTTEHLPLEDWLGEPPKEQCKKIKMRSVIDMKELLPWILPASFTFCPPSKQLFDEKRALSCLDGIACVELKSFKSDVIDDFMTVFRGPKVKLSHCSVWSRESFNAVFTAHANDDGSSAPRCIQCVMMDSAKFYSAAIRARAPAMNPYLWPLSKTEDQWKEMFTSWKAAHIAEFGEPKRQINHEIVFDGGYRFRFNLL